MPIAVSIVEDELKTRESLLRLLGRAPHVRCVGNYATGEEALRGFRRKNQTWLWWTSICPA